MGRRPDNPLDQAAKGFPGKRKSKTEKAIAEAERLAALLAAARSSTPSGGKPGFLGDARLKAASSVWDDYAARLDRLHLLSHLDVHVFGAFCIYAAEFVAANEDILAKGYSVLVRTVSGDRMPRENPSVARRDVAAKMMLELSKRFGLTPADRNKLLRDGALRFDDEILYGRVVQKAGAEEPDPKADRAGAADASAIGSLNDFDSAPPGTKPN